MACGDGRRAAPVRDPDLAARAGRGFHAADAAALRRASRLRATSSSVVDQLLTEMRSTALPCQREPVIQAVPSAMRRAVTSAVRSSEPKLADTWEKTTSFSTVAPSMASMPLANAFAWRQKPSTRSATP